MMKRTFTMMLLSVLVSAFAVAQTHIGAKFTPKLTTTNPDSAYFGDIGIRGAWVAPDLDKDGKPEILVTDYTKTGRVHAFQAAGNDTVEWIWSSPRLDLVSGQPDGAGGSSTPRTIRSGDLDGDGRGEIIFPRAGTAGGFLIFEWDGTVGSHKFGTAISAKVPQTVPYGPNFGALAGTPVEGGLQLTVEHFEVMDVDGDGKQELIIPKNLSSTPNDDYLIISATGEWDYENPLFSGFQVEGSTNRLASVKFGGGAPYAIHPADLNGDGKKELVAHNWNFGDYFVIKNTAADTYVIADTSESNLTRYRYLTPAYDHVALFGGAAGDIDSDGNDEVFLAMYDDAGGDAGSLFMIDYNTSDDVLKADSTHVFKIMPAASQNLSGQKMSSFNSVIADIDRNGKKEVLVGSSYPSNVVAVEFNGGDIRTLANWTRKVIYTGEAKNFAAVTYRDSAGVKDTVTTVGEGFVSKMAPPLDVDGDGKLEIILPYQGMNDSITYSWRRWQDTAFVTDSSKKVSNPRKWAFRMLESDVAGSVDNKEMTVIMPEDYLLSQNYPNPFNPTTTINFTLPLNKKVTAKIYDILGKEVRALINNEDIQKGTHSVVWNGRDNNGRQVSSGTYIFKMNAGNIEKSMKMMLVK